MTFKKFEWRILVRIIILFLTLATASYLIMSSLYVYLFLVVPLIIFELVDFYRFMRKTHDELNQFVESVHYRDFSRFFDV